MRLYYKEFRHPASSYLSRASLPCVPGRSLSLILLWSDASIVARNSIPWAATLRGALNRRFGPTLAVWSFNTTHPCFINYQFPLHFSPTASLALRSAAVTDRLSLRDLLATPSWLRTQVASCQRGLHGGGIHDRRWGLLVALRPTCWLLLAKCLRNSAATAQRGASGKPFVVAVVNHSKITVNRV